MMLSKSLIVSGLPSSYIESPGEGVPLIFLHGWGQNKEAFGKIYSELEQKNIAFFGVDFPGFGSTAIPRETWGIQDFADFTYEFITKKKIERFIIVGHSFGGRVGIVLASRGVEGLKKLILIGSAGILPRISLSRRLSISGANLFLGLPGGSKLRPMIRNIFGSQDDKNAGPLRDIFRNVIREDLEPLLQDIKIPTLLLWGALDRETPLQDGELMKEKIPNSELKVFKEGTHFIYDELPEEISQKIITFLA